MKNKKLTYILVPLVIIIWGGIFYRVFVYLNKTPYLNPQVVSRITDNIEEVKNDTFSIIADYRDPFLDKKIKFKNNPVVRNTKASVQPAKKNITKTKDRPKKRIKWPKISYGGLVQNPKSGDKIGLIKLNDKDHIIKAGETINNISIDQVFEDSVVIIFMEEYKTFRK